MKTKLVYVVVSTIKDIYLEQAYVSMYSAKYYMPDSHITLLTDSITASTFTNGRKDKLKYVDELVVANLDAKFDAKRRSRLLKTSVRLYVNGDYMFIDTDTIITKPLYEIDNVKYDIAACWDTHAIFSENPYRKMCLTHGKKLKWPIENENKYFNSGIIYAKDTPIVHEFYKKWNHNYIESNKLGLTMDQPSFAKTNFELGHIVETLDDIWNCELKHGIKFLQDAKIIHYLTTNKSANKTKQLFIMNDAKVFMKIKESATINEEIIRTIQNPFYGIANITYCFAGEDVHFLQTRTFKFFRKLYNKKIFVILDLFIRFINKIFQL